jgi:Flp pilus assembly protein TadG
MRRMIRDQRGATAMEFGLVAMVFFFMLFGIFDLGRYGITVHSLDTLASTSARQVIINCVSSNLINRTSSAGCTADPYTATQKQNIAPFLYVGGLTPTVAVTVVGSSLTVTASQPGFTMIMPFWGTTLNAPSLSQTVPF